MLKSLLAKIKSYLNPPQQSEIERYISSKNPQTPGDVDHWLAEYDNERRIRSRDFALSGLDRH